MKLSELIQNSNIKEVCGEKLIFSTNTNAEKIRKFVLFLENENTKNNCYILFRGQNKNDFWANLENHTKHFEQFSKYQKLFMLGAGKAKQYLKNTSSKFIVDINDTSTKIIRQIFTDINKHTLASKKDKEEKELIKYFNDKKNESHFINAIGNNITVRDYYLRFLHTKDSNRNHYTYFISTSTKWDKAEEFANNGYVVCMFYPQPIKSYGINLSIANNEIKPELFALNLPIIKKELFEDEFEVSIKGALFPHFMFGIYDLCKKEFIVNPHFIYDNNNNADILNNGIKIDQSNFNDILRDSNYRNGVSRFYNGLYKNYK